MVVLTFSFCVSSFFVVLFASVATLASVKSFVGVAVANLSTSATPVSYTHLTLTGTSTVIVLPFGNSTVTLTGAFLPGVRCV